MWRASRYVCSHRSLKGFVINVKSDSVFKKGSFGFLAVTQ